MGDNSTGKTTLLHAVGGKSGVVVGGEVYHGVSPSRVVNYQTDGKILARARALEGIGVPCLVKSVLEPDMLNSMTTNGLESDLLPPHLLDARVINLTPGELRLVSLACALHRKYDLLLLDEVFDTFSAEERASLLPKIKNALYVPSATPRQQTSSLSQKHQRQQQFVMCTHRVADAVAFGDLLTHVVLLNKHRQVEYAGPLTREKRESLFAPITEQLMMEARRTLPKIYDAMGATLACYHVVPPSRIRIAFDTLMIDTSAGLIVPICGSSNVVQRLYDAPPSDAILDGATMHEKRRLMSLASPRLQSAMFANSHTMSAKDIVLSGLTDDAISLSSLKVDRATSKAAEAWLDVFIPSWREEPPFTSLSQGKQMAVLLARAFVAMKPVIGLDRAFNGLDSSVRMKLRSVIYHVVANTRGRRCYVVLVESPEQGDLVFED